MNDFTNYSAERPSTTSVSVYSRHIPTCPGFGDIYYRGKDCNCIKWIYVNAGGKRSRFSAKTRYWKKAEQVAQDERNKYDPKMILHREIEEQARQKALVEEQKQSDRITIDRALERWMARHKGIEPGTRIAYQSVVNKISRWAKRTGVTCLDEISTSMLDEWRSVWAKTAEDRDDRMDASAQATFQRRLKGIFTWAVSIKLVPHNPATALARIRPNSKRTIPLTREQFKALMATIEPFCAASTNEAKNFAQEFTALFLLQRYTGLRLVDCLVLPRSALVGNRLKLRTQKTKALVERVVPDEVVDALQALKVDRPGFKPDHFMWATGCAKMSLSVKWSKHIAGMDKVLNFKDEHGNRFKFHSHALRDTFAVEMLLEGLSLEEVARLLTDTVAIVERYYGHWSKARRELLEERQIAALRRMGMTVTV